MAHAATVRDLLAIQLERTFVGRESELSALARILETPARPVTFIHGIGGIGKSRLLEAFSIQARAAGAYVVRLDCRQFEPTPSGFLRELGSAAGGDTASVREASDRLAAMQQRVILILDNYEVLRLLDTWLRQEFIPALPSKIHAILCGRAAPVAAWLYTPGWAGLFRSIELEPLPETEALELLSFAGIPEIRARHINRFTRGHPLALTLAAATFSDHGRAGLEDLALHRVIEELARLYLAEISDDLVRRALEATSVVRCATVSLLRAMLPDVAPQDVYERLRAIPLVQTQRDGIQVHDSLQQAIALGLKASDPSRYLSYRRAAWRQLRTEGRTAPVSALWRYTADLLYMLENPLVREAFFPTNAQTYTVEPARLEDAGPIFDIARRWDSAGAARCLEHWWQFVPHSFSVVKDSTGRIEGFYCMFDLESVTPEMCAGDPVVEDWLAHLEANPIPPLQNVLFCRRWLSREVGEAPCGVQGACFLDIKRAYMPLRPHLRRVYVTVRELETYAPAFLKLGFRMLPGVKFPDGGGMYPAAMVDFGPSSVDGWLAGLVAAELGVNSNELLDMEARELVIGDRRVPLTPLEFSLMRYLHEHEGTAVGRGSLLRDVWGHKYDVGSNVVDVVVRALRKKLGLHAGLIETVPGVGYRFRRVAPDAA